MSAQHTSSAKRPEDRPVSIQQESENQNRTVRSQFWRVLNAPFIVALIPSIAIVFVPILYSNFEASFERERFQRKIDNEIQARTKHTIRRLSTLKTKEWHTASLSDVHEVTNAIGGFAATHYSPTKGVYPELKHLPTTLLLQERPSLSVGFRGPDVNVALETLRGIELRLSNFMVQDLEYKGKNVESLIEYVLTNLRRNLKYWVPSSRAT